MKPLPTDFKVFMTLELIATPFAMLLLSRIRRTAQAKWIALDSPAVWNLLAYNLGAKYFKFLATAGFRSLSDDSSRFLGWAAFFPMWGGWTVMIVSILHRWISSS